MIVQQSGLLLPGMRLGRYGLPLVVRMTAREGMVVRMTARKKKLVRRMGRRREAVR
jgi:hypothetical protein